MSFRRSLALWLALSVRPFVASSQDVEMLGERYGTRPPDGYYRELARNPGAYQFARGRAARARADALARAALAGAGDTRARGPAAALGPRDGPVVGSVRIPVVLGLFFDSPSAPPPYGAAEVQALYFDHPSASVSAYYEEVSGGRVDLRGDVRDWVRSSLSQAQVTQDESGLVCCGIGDFIRDLVAAQRGLDWGVYDNDGPDGIPNSGDDDGYVDALAVMHPTSGAECDRRPDRIWSHKWHLSSAASLGEYVTSSPRAGGGRIRVDDYFIQGVLSCSGTSLNEIGVFTHETGHAFGLPDLYDTRLSGPRHAGAGVWDLMAAGTWGCNDRDPSRPCHLSAWSKAVLGWVDVVTLARDTDHGTLTLPPVLTSGTIYRIEAQDGSDEYFLLENRQDLGSSTFDRNLFAEGLLIWQIDPDWVAARWPTNTVNASHHMGVWLRQADGLDDLGTPGRGRGDAGDPFPGSTGNRYFHSGTNPAARTFGGTAAGVALLEIALVGDDVRFSAVTGHAILAVAPRSVTITATMPQDIRLTAQNATAPVSWVQVGGALPEGLTLSRDGRVAGAAIELGTFPVVVEATDAVGLSATSTITFDVGEPTFPIGQLASPFLLRGLALDSVQAAFLDRQGNRNGVYDVGDFRAWVLAHPSLPLGAEVAALAGARR
jgi:M6 family metalloprotease-like protein